MDMKDTVGVTLVKEMAKNGLIVGLAVGGGGVSFGPQGFLLGGALGSAIAFLSSFITSERIKSSSNIVIRLAMSVYNIIKGRATFKGSMFVQVALMVVELISCFLSANPLSATPAPALTHEPTQLRN